MILSQNCSIQYVTTVHTRIHVACICREDMYDQEHIKPVKWAREHVACSTEKSNLAADFHYCIWKGQCTCTHIMVAFDFDQLLIRDLEEA